jgi:hypothetical protein
MALYALPNESIYTITDVLGYANDATGGIMIVGFLLAIFIIIIMISMAKGYDLPESGVMAGFILAVISMLFQFAGFDLEWYLWLFVAIAIIGSGFLYLKKEY